jgi:hypothetical protein
MCFFVAAMVLLVALLTGALITPAHGNSQSFWTDFWAPDMLGWSIIDHDCSDRVFFVHRQDPRPRRLFAGVSRRVTGTPPV